MMSKSGKIYSQIWNHFQMLPCKTRARCYHCQKTITCFRHGTSNCKRHLARKHPNYYNGKEYIKFNPMEEETLYDNDADDDGNYEPSINDETSQHEEEYAITEVQFVDCPTPQSKRKEMQDRADEKPSSGKLSNSISRETKRDRDSGQKEELDDTREGKSEQLTMSIFKEINKHFSKVSRCKTRVRCNYCTVYIDVAKDMVAVCKKHLYRAHPSVFNGKDFGEYNPDEKQLIRERKAKKRDIQRMARNLKLSSEETWKHFIRMQGTTRARCNYCHTVISYSEGSASNCKRHLYRKHALILLKDPTLGNATEVKVEEILYEEDLDASTFISSFNPSLPSTDDDTTVKEVQFVKNPYLSEPIRIEIQGTVSPNDEQGDADASANENVGDYQELSGSGNIEVIEQLIQSDDPYLSDDGHSRSVSPVTDTNMQIVKYFSLRDPGVESLDPIGVEDRGKRRPTKAGPVKVKKESSSVAVPARRSDTGVSSQRSSLQNTSHGSRSGLESMKNFLDQNNVSIRSTMAATTMALALNNLPVRQKIIAEKLIGEVLFHGKRGALTEHAMVLSRANTFEYEYVQ